MARARSPKREQALKLWLESGGKRELLDIARELEVSDSQIRKWKCQDKWDKSNVTLDKNGNITKKKKRGGQPGNKNAGDQRGNKKAEKYGFLSKYLPDETKEIFDEIATADALDLLWHQIQIAYAAIIRAQRIAYVKDQEDMSRVLQMESEGIDSNTYAYEIQQAWDKQAKFLSAQANAQRELRNLIKQYDEMLHHSWELATEEQRARLEMFKAKTEQLNSIDDDIGVTIINDAPTDQNL